MRYLNVSEGGRIEGWWITDNPSLYPSAVPCDNPAVATDTHYFVDDEVLPRPFTATSIDKTEIVGDEEDYCTISGIVSTDTIYVDGARVAPPEDGTLEIDSDPRDAPIRVCIRSFPERDVEYTITVVDPT
jgi:hypothetical protein